MSVFVVSQYVIYSWFAYEFVFEDTLDDWLYNL